MVLLFSHSASPMLLTPEQPKREFTCKLRPVRCKEVDMVNYLLDSYERVSLEERTAPKVCFDKFYQMTNKSIFF